MFRFIGILLLLRLFNFLGVIRSDGRQVVQLIFRILKRITFFIFLVKVGDCKAYLFLLLFVITKCTIQIFILFVQF